MDRLIYSDTDYFYSKFQKIVYCCDMLEITTDFVSAVEIPERGRHLLRLDNEAQVGDRFEKVTGPVLNKKFLVSVEHDRYGRIRILVTSGR